MKQPRLYVPLDVDYLDDEKFDGVSVEAELLYIRSLCLVKRRMSDGFIDRRQLRRLCDRFDGDPVDAATELVAEGLWTTVDGGWTVAAWLKHNPSKADIEERRAAEAERKASYRKRDEVSHVARRGTNPRATDSPTGQNVARRAAEAEAQAETEAAAPVPQPVDNSTAHDRTVELLLLRRRRQHEQTGKPIQNPDAWTRSVRAGLITEHSDRIAADLALGLTPDTIAASILPDRNNDPPMAAFHRLDHNAAQARALALVAPEDR